MKTIRIGSGAGYGGSGCVARAQQAAKIIRHRLKPWQDQIQELRMDLIGVNSLYGSGHVGVDDASAMVAREMPAEPAEVRLRVALRSEDRRCAATCGEEVEALYTNGPAERIKDIAICETIMAGKTTYRA